MSESKKLAELAEVTAELKRTKAALERAERIVFDQRQEGTAASPSLTFSVAIRVVWILLESHCALYPCHVLEALFLQHVHKVCWKSSRTVIC